MTVSAVYLQARLARSFALTHGSLHILILHVCFAMYGFAMHMYEDLEIRRTP